MSDILFQCRKCFNIYHILDYRNIKNCCKRCNDKRICICKKRPSFGLPNDEKATCCATCKTEGMVDIVSKKCKTYLCDIRPSPKYKGFCCRCFCLASPNTPISRNHKTKENTIAKLILKDFPNFDWILDRIVKNGCSKRRPDVYCDFGSHVLIIEVDENQHSNYSCENKRIMEISQDFNHRPCIFIRFNPDTYIDKNNKKIQSCFVIKKDTGKVEIRCEKELDRRMNELKKEIEKYSEGFVSNITVITSELFYTD